MRGTHFGRELGVVLNAVLELEIERGAPRRRDAGEANAFLAPDVLPRMVNEFEAAFNGELAKQGGS